MNTHIAIVEEWIKSRFKDGLPLNISAVEKERPDLLEVVFSGESPIGWRRSLLAAGVDPYTMRHELERNVTCLECGAEMMVLGSHLRAAHKMDQRDYHVRYGPRAPLSSEQYRVNHHLLPPILGIPHWERLWTSWYELDWILLLKEMGRPLHWSASGGKPGSDKLKSLGTAAIKTFGSWDKALAAASITPGNVRKIPLGRSWNRKMILDSVRNLAKLRETEPRRRMSYALENSVQKHFGGLSGALRAAGLEPAKVLVRVRVAPLVERQALVEKIKAAVQLYGVTRRRALLKIWNNPKHKVARSHYGTLRCLARREGFTQLDVSIVYYRHAADVHHDLDELEKKGVELSHSAIKAAGYSPLYQAISAHGWGRERLVTKSKALANAHMRLLRFPPCNPRSGLMRDQMIILRRRLRISCAKAASLAGTGLGAWQGGEVGTSLSEKNRLKILRLLAEHNLSPTCT